MALAKYTGLAPCPGASIAVYLRGTLSLVSLFEDLDGTVPLANPFTVDAHTGLYRFIAEQGDYDVTIRTADNADVPIDPSIRQPDAETYIVAFGVSPDRHVTLIADDEGEQIVVAEQVY